MRCPFYLCFTIDRGSTKNGLYQTGFFANEKKYSRGITIYNALEKDQQESVKKMISCKTDNDMVMDLETVVHESIHLRQTSIKS